MEKPNTTKWRCQAKPRKNLSMRTLYFFPYLNLNIETPPKNIIKQKCNKNVISPELCNGVFDQLLKKYSHCQTCGLRFKSLLTLHLVFENETKGKDIKRKFQKFELICIYCHRVKHLLNIIESNQDFSMDLKWLKSVNNFSNKNFEDYIKEINRLNERIKNFNYEKCIDANLCNLFYNEEFMNVYECNMDFILDQDNCLTDVQFQIGCYFHYQVDFLTTSEVVLQEVIIRDRENRKRIYIEQEGILKNKYEYGLVLKFISEIEKLFNNQIFILEYEWEIKEMNKIIGMGDLVMTDLTDFYVCEIKFLNGKNDFKKLKKVNEQIERYTQLFKIKKLDKASYSEEFINEFSHSKIYGVAFTNEDCEIKCSYILDDEINSCNEEEDSTSLASLDEIENEDEDILQEELSQLYEIY